MTTRPRPVGRSSPPSNHNPHDPPTTCPPPKPCLSETPTANFVSCGLVRRAVDTIDTSGETVSASGRKPGGHTPPHICVLSGYPLQPHQSHNHHDPLAFLINSLCFPDLSTTPPLQRSTHNPPPSNPNGPPTTPTVPRAPFRTARHIPCPVASDPPPVHPERALAACPPQGGASVIRPCAASGRVQLLGGGDYVLLIPPPVGFPNPS